MGCPNCVTALAGIGPGYWAAFFLIGVFAMLAGFMIFVVRRDGATNTDHLDIKQTFMDCEDDLDYSGRE